MIERKGDINLLNTALGVEEMLSIFVVPASRIGPNRLPGSRDLTKSSRVGRVYQLKSGR